MSFEVNNMFGLGCIKAGRVLAGCFFAVVFSFPVLGGPIQRVPNTTLAMPATPPIYGYSVTNAFGALNFFDPVCIANPPGETNRLFVVERGGTIAVITNLASPDRSVFLDISNEVTHGLEECGLLCLTFHPGYATNGYFYVWYTGTDTTSNNTGMHDILSRFQVSSTNANVANGASETKIIRQYDRSSSHNAGDLHFGADGYLYVSLGDEGCCNDTNNNSQMIDHNFFSGLIRIDVDMKPGDLTPNPNPAVTTNYLVPPDNPFVGVTTFNGTNVNTNTLRTEFWAVGLRNPWRFSFDAPTGLLYLADVGQDAVEEVDIITKGGNYGWAWREGNIAGPKTMPTNVTANLINPILAYPHGLGTNQGFCIIGGVVYRGMQISQLAGCYIFGDNVSGNIWSLYYNGTNATNWQLLANMVGISSFGTDPRNGDVLIAARGPEGTTTNNQPLQRLVYSTNFVGAPLPATLADTGAFSNLTTLTPNAGIIPYSINVPFWSDNAVKSRWISVPNTNQFITFSTNGPWTFPAGTVWIKHFDLQTNDSPPMSTRVETRFIVRNSNGVYGVTYRWGGSTTNATLVPDGGMDENFAINNGGTITTQSWHYPGRSECLACHTSLGGLGLGFNTAQLNCVYYYTNAGVATNQIKALSDAGYFTTSITNINLPPALASATNTAVSAEYRVRSYLAANCSQCHQPGGSALGLWDARISTPGPQTGIINGALVNNLGDTNNLVIVPGSLSNSVLYNRVLNLGTSHMPPLDTTVVNTQAVQLLSSWITNDLLSYQTYNAWAASHFGTNTANTNLMQDFDHDGALNYLEYLTGTDPVNPLSYWSIGILAGGGSNTIYFPEVADRGFEVQRNYSLLNSNGWVALDVPANAPFFSSSNLTKYVSDTAVTNTAYYRVRVFEP